MLWEVEIRPSANEVDREGLRVTHEAHALGATTIHQVRSARSFLLQGTTLADGDVRRAAASLLVDPVAETFSIAQISGKGQSDKSATEAKGRLVPMPRN
jgi:phosphoribosylformylglycinamidine (FGAM) synthase PurS component